MLAVLAGIAALIALLETTGAPARTSRRVPLSLLPNAVAFVDRSHGVLGTGYRYRGHEGGAIELSSDGGRTWHIVRRTATPVVALTPYGRFFLAQLEDGERLESRDNGRTWRPASRLTWPTWPPEYSVCPIGFFVGENAGDPSWSLCTTQSGAGNEGKAVYRIPAAGEWRRVACTNFSTAHFPCGKHSYGGIGSVGYAVGVAGASRGGFGLIWESRGTVLVTRDGGRHWTGRPKLAMFDQDFGNWAFVLPRGGVGFVILSRGAVHDRLVETTDYGRTWRVVHRWR